MATWIRSEAAPSWLRVGYRQGLLSLVVSVWPVELAKHPQSRRPRRAFPQVRALPPPPDRTPKAGVGSSNLPRRTGCLCWSWRVTVPLVHGSRGRHRAGGQAREGVTRREVIDRRGWRRPSRPVRLAGFEPATPALGVRSRGGSRALTCGNARNECRQCVGFAGSTDQTVTTH